MLARLGVMQDQTVEMKKQAEEAATTAATSGKELEGMRESDESF